MLRNKKCFIYELLCTHPDYYGMKYIGSHYGYIDDEYKGSGKYLCIVRKEIGDVWFDRTILETVDIKADLVPLENKYLQKLDVANNSMYFNLVNNNADWDKGRDHSGMVWAYNPKTNEQRFFKETNIPKSWVKGNPSTKNKQSFWKGKKLPQKIIDKIANEWSVTHPNGKEETITNMLEFCRSNNLNPSTMSSVARGKRSHHKGYKCKITINKKDNGYVYREFKPNEDMSIYARYGCFNNNSKPITINGKKYCSMLDAMKELKVYYYKLKKMIQNETENKI